MLVAGLMGCSRYDDPYVSATCMPSVIKMNSKTAYKYYYTGVTLQRAEYVSLENDSIISTIDYTYENKLLVKAATTPTGKNKPTSYSEYEYNSGEKLAKATNFVLQADTITYLQTGYKTFNYDIKGNLFRETTFDGTSSDLKEQRTYEYDVQNNKTKMYLKVGTAGEYYAERYLYDDNKGTKSAFPAPLRGDKNNLLFMERYDAMGKVIKGARYTYAYAPNETRYPVKFYDPLTKVTYEITYNCR
ncbi:hypothetical protein [Flexibacter flexilis]|nr:hypothetical protein [Flexibacter flexilis]